MAIEARLADQEFDAAAELCGDGIHLGARGVNVVALVLKSGLALTGLGIAVGA